MWLCCVVILCTVSLCCHLSVNVTLPPLSWATAWQHHKWPTISLANDAWIVQSNTQANQSKQSGVCRGKNKHTHTIASKENNWNHSARHLWSSRVPHCTYVGMSSLCACIGCMRICSLSPLSFRGGIVLPVVDLRVEVTVEDVIEGKQSSSWE